MLTTYLLRYTSECTISSSNFPHFLRLRRQGGIDPPNHNPADARQCNDVTTIADLRRSDSGLYTCKATSDTGQSTWNAYLVVEASSNPRVIFHRTPEPSAFPGPPSRPDVMEVTETTARLAWRASSNHGASPVVAFTVEYFSHETGQVSCVCVILIIMGIPSPTHSFTLGLNPYFSANPPYRSLSFFFFRTHYMDFPDCLLLLLSISVSLLFSFFLFLHFLVVGSVR